MQQTGSPTPDDGLSIEEVDFPATEKAPIEESRSAVITRALVNMIYLFEERD